MIEIPITINIIDGQGGLQTKSFLLNLNCDIQSFDIIKTSLTLLTSRVIKIPGYSGETTDYTLNGLMYVPPVNFIGTLNETITAILRLYVYKALETNHWQLSENFGGLTLTPFDVPNGIPMEYVYDIEYNNGPVPFVKWTHSSLYKPTCFSCTMGVRELMNAIEYCKGKIVTERSNVPNSIMLKASDDIQNEFVNWFTGSFQGTLETAHVDVIEFITPWRTISRKLGY